MNKCENCIWANKVNAAVIHCPFPTRCTKEDGFIADIKECRLDAQKEKD